jgi:hypothetical protein
MSVNPTKNLSLLKYRIYARAVPFAHPQMPTETGIRPGRSTVPCKIV